MTRPGPPRRWPPLPGRTEDPEGHGHRLVQRLVQPAAVLGVEEAASGERRGPAHLSLGLLVGEGEADDVHARLGPGGDEALHRLHRVAAALLLAVGDQDDHTIAAFGREIPGRLLQRVGPAADYLNRIRSLCDQHELLMMLDEIQTGIGRTGKFLAFQHNNIIPDVCTLAKALGNGVPIGACLARGKAAQLLTAGNHGSTFGGNPLACSAALAVLATLDEENLIEQARQKGQAICAGFIEHLKGNKHVVDIRHKGLMIGIELDSPCAELVKSALQQRLLINVTNETTIRLLPPLIIDEQQIKLLVETLSTLITEYTEQTAQKTPS